MRIFCRVEFIQCENLEMENFHIAKVYPKVNILKTKH